MANPWSSWHWKANMEMSASLNGQVCVVTGANAGIGLEITKSLAQKGAEVVMVCRKISRGKSALTEIRKKIPTSLLTLLVADLSIQDEIRHVADEISTKYPKIKLLVNNAGTTQRKRLITAEGFEKTFAVNHLAPFLLTNLLLDQIKQAAPSRIITLSSAAHRHGTIDFSNLHGEKRYSVCDAYSRSKLANILFTKELARRLNGSNVIANCLHPGVVYTGIWQFNAFMRFMSPMIGRFMLSPEKGAQTALWAATNPEAGKFNGAYFDKSKPVSTSPRAEDPRTASRLWAESIKMTGIS